jgi:hypothetical protein
MPILQFQSVTRTNSWNSRHPVDSPALGLTQLALMRLSGVPLGAVMPVKVDYNDMVGAGRNFDVTPPMWGLAVPSSLRHQYVSCGLDFPLVCRCRLGDAMMQKTLTISVQ